MRGEFTQLSPFQSGPVSRPDPKAPERSRKSAAAPAVSAHVVERESVRLCVIGYPRGGPNSGEPLHMDAWRSRSGMRRHRVVFQAAVVEAVQGIKTAARSDLFLG